ncbi:MAG: response regulator transcription factor [Dehalococcoidia bacterium]|nr:response regulator transcription factor [Dehalococcoidia bacterium]
MNNTNHQLRVLVIDSLDAMQETVLLGFGLRWPGCIAFSARGGEEGVHLADSKLPHIVILNIYDLPDMSGFEVIRRIRLFSDVPLIVVSEQRDEMDMFKSFELGADDFIIKPLRPLDLMVRTNAVLRRWGKYASYQHSPVPYVDNDLVVDFSAQKVFAAGEPVHLTPTEYGILCKLVRNNGRIVTVDMLRQEANDNIDELTSSTIRKSISHLRSKLANNGGTHSILNERGYGYRFISLKQEGVSSKREE